ncbi:apolipoprotein N-acyltransferase [Treponema ruminis]|uniref:Apolipoprotein N-acyltransferase n=1 Tax=Treponema ruminis TaxID=744515 RepID=A0A7W8LLE9_9SPIR|nr:apolipoprotein N-acyltransferase [Treponema ruminis]MBB5225290.1 apolipoprotein N-acyltransferase [Treponema ruminis]
MKRSNLLDFILLLISLFFLFLSQPSFLFEDGCSFFAWIAYIPFFILASRLALKASFFFGALHGFLFCLFLCPWLSQFGLIALLFVSCIFAFYNSISLFLISFFQKYCPQKFSSSLWILRIFPVLALEFLRTKGFLAFSYGVIGYSQWQIPAFLKFSSLFGVWGVSFLILLVNSLLAKIISEKNVRNNLKKFSLCLSLVLAVFIFWLSDFLIPQGKNPSVLSVALIQNASSSSSRDISDYERDSLLLQKLTDRALASNPESELIVWPETAIVPDFLFHAQNPSDKRRHELSEKLLSFISGKNSAFLIGSNHRDGRKTYNSALYFSPKESGAEVYNKNILVPFTEYWPSFLDFEFFDGLKSDLNCDLFEKGSEVKIFKIGKLNFASPICFEDSFSPLIRKMKKKGAEFFVNISDDAWASSEAARKMHLSMSVFRAAEYSSPFIRSTIDGKTCVIDSRGKVTGEIPCGIDGFLCAKIEVEKNSRTPYIIIGDVFIWAITIFTLIFLLILSAGFVKVKCYGRR